MFALPPVIPTVVWARLPDPLRITKPKEPWTAYRFPDKPDSFLEGPPFDRQGDLYVVDIPHGGILRLPPAPTWMSCCEYDGEPNGLAIHRVGSIFIADYRNGILTLDPE